jgi:hypothetical protein
VFCKTALTDRQGHGLATGIPNDRMDWGFFHSATVCQSDAILF